MTQEKISKLLRDKLQLNDIKFDAVHRFGKAIPASAQDEDAPVTPAKPRPIIARFHRLCDRNEVLRKSHMLGSSSQRIFVYEDLCIASQELVKTKLSERREAKNNGYVAFFRGTRLIKYPRRTLEATSGDDVSDGGSETSGRRSNTQRRDRGGRGGRGRGSRGRGAGSSRATQSTHDPLRAGPANTHESEGDHQTERADVSTELMNQNKSNEANQAAEVNPGSVETRSKAKVKQ